MLKKALISTALLTLVVVNLILWPYLLKEFTGTDQEVNGNMNQDFVENEEESLIEKEENPPSQNIEREETSNENNEDDQGVESESFKVLSIE